MTLRLTIRFLLATAVSCLFLAYAFRHTDGHALWQRLHEVQWPGVLLYGLGLACTQAARAFRWGRLVQPFAKLDTPTLWRISNVGNMLIMLLPLRLGELGRPYMMREACGAPLSASMGAAVIERVLDGLLVSGLFFAVTWLQGPAYAISPALRAGAQLALGIFMSAVVVLYAAHRSATLVPTLVRGTLGRVAPGLAEKILAMVLAFIDGLRALPSIGAAAAVVGWTLAYWAANALGMYALTGAFGWHLPLVSGFTVVCVLVIGVMIPAGPGLLGTYQAAIMAGLSIYGVDKDASAAFSVVAYAGNLAIIVGFALPSLVGENRITWRRTLAPSLNANLKA